jgi:hypothetical protein
MKHANATKKTKSSPMAGYPLPCLRGHPQGDGIRNAKPPLRRWGWEKTVVPFGYLIGFSGGSMVVYWDLMGFNGSYPLVNVYSHGSHHF